MTGFSTTLSFGNINVLLKLLLSVRSVVIDVLLVKSNQEFMKSGVADERNPLTVQHTFI